MLDIALKYKDELQKLYINTWHQDKYKYYHYNCYHSLPEFTDSTWNGHDFVSINDKGQIVGCIWYAIRRETNSVYNLCIINFTDDIITFGKDLRQALKDIFEKFNFHKLSYSVVIGNPVEKQYDKLTLKYGGRIVGVEKQDTKLFDNKYYDVKRYEILREDYMKAKENENETIIQM